MTNFEVWKEKLTADTAADILGELMFYRDREFIRKCLICPASTIAGESYIISNMKDSIDIKRIYSSKKEAKTFISDLLSEVENEK